MEKCVSRITVDDLGLLCDLFYLPFEHGSRGHKLLSEFNWLKGNANVILQDRSAGGGDAGKSAKPEVSEWLLRSEHFDVLCGNVLQLLIKIANCQNKEICHELYSYVWDISGALSLLNCYIKWLALGQFPQNMSSYTEGSYTCKFFVLNYSYGPGTEDHSILFQGSARAGRKLSCLETRSLGSFVAA